MLPVAYIVYSSFDINNGMHFFNPITAERYMQSFERENNPKEILDFVCKKTSLVIFLSHVKSPHL